MNYFASLGISCVRDAGRRGNKISESLSAMISGIVWVAKCYIWLDSGCLEYGRPIKTNAFTPKLCQKLLRPKLVGRKNNYKTFHRSHKFDTENSPTRISPRGVQKYVRVPAPHDICLSICLPISFYFVAWYWRTVFRATDSDQLAASQTGRVQKAASVLAWSEWNRWVDQWAASRGCRWGLWERFWTFRGE